MMSLRKVLRVHWILEKMNDIIRMKNFDIYLNRSQFSVYVDSDSIALIFVNIFYTEENKYYKE
jgi:hypothetical protein